MRRVGCVIGGIDNNYDLIGSKCATYGDFDLSVVEYVRLWGSYCLIRQYHGLIVSLCQFYCVGPLVSLRVNGEIFRIVFVGSKSVVYRRSQDCGAACVVILCDSVDSFGPVVRNLYGKNLHAPVSWRNMG